MKQIAKFYRRDLFLNRSDDFVDRVDGMNNALEIMDSSPVRDDSASGLAFDLNDGGKMWAYYNRETKLLDFSMTKATVDVFEKRYDVYLSIRKSRIENADYFESMTQSYLRHPYGYLILKTIGGIFDNINREDRVKYKNLRFSDLCGAADKIYCENKASLDIRAVSDFVRNESNKVRMDEDLQSMRVGESMYETALKLLNNPSLQVEDEDLKISAENIRDSMSAAEIQAKLVELESVNDYYALCQKNPLWKFEVLLWLAARNVLPEKEYGSSQEFVHEFWFGKVSESMV